MQLLKAIETRYKGYRFRSRTEARWAVAFDAMGIEWEYEKEGYELPSGWYLPDFWLPGLKTFAEVKDGFPKTHETKLLMDLAEASGCECVFLDGIPNVKPYAAINHHVTDGPIRLFEVFSVLPRVVGDAFNNRLHAFVHWSEEPCMSIACGLYSTRDIDNGSCIEKASQIISPCKECSQQILAAKADCQRVVSAARSARFEHGERGW